MICWRLPGRSLREWYAILQRPRDSLFEIVIIVICLSPGVVDYAIADIVAFVHLDADDGIIAVLVVVIDDDDVVVASIVLFMLLLSMLLSLFLMLLFL